VLLFTKSVYLNETRNILFTVVSSIPASSKLPNLHV